MAALVTSLPGLVPVAVVLAGIALRRIKRNGGRGKGFAYGALVVCLCWGIFTGVAVALGLYGQLRDGVGRTLPIAEVEVGRCFDADLEAATLRMARIANCRSEHSGEAYAKVRADLAGRSAAETQTIATGACTTAFGAFVGKAYEQSDLDMYYVVLEDRAVADGNVLCLVGMPGTRLSGSMRGSQR